MHERDILMGIVDHRQIVQKEHDLLRIEPGILLNAVIRDAVILERFLVICLGLGHGPEENGEIVVCQGAQSLSPVVRRRASVRNQLSAGDHMMDLPCDAESFIPAVFVGAAAFRTVRNEQFAARSLCFRAVSSETKPFRLAVRDVAEFV